MMSKPEKMLVTPVNGSGQCSFPPGAPSPPNSTPSQFQWSIVPGPNGANVLSTSSPWNISVGPQNFTPNFSTSHQWNTQPFTTTHQIPNDVIPQLTGVTSCHQTFLKGKPKALGIVLIVTSICEILFAVSLPFLAVTITFISGSPFWGPVFYIIAGSLTIRAQKKPSISLVKSAYGLNIVSSIFSITAVIINIVDFSYISCEPYYYQCLDEGAGAYTIVSILLVMNLLVFCTAVSIAVFGGRALEHVPTNVPPVFVIQNVVSVPPSSYPENSSETSIPAPPPYEAQVEHAVKNTNS